MPNDDYTQNHSNTPGFDSTPAGKIDLATFDSHFSGATTPEEGYAEIPDGHYQVNLDRIELLRSQKTGEPMIKWTLRIFAPNYQNRLPRPWRQPHQDSA